MSSVCKSCLAFCAVFALVACSADESTSRLDESTRGGGQSTRRLPTSSSNDSASLSSSRRLVDSSTRPRLVDSSTPVLRVCADPNNLPFSNDRREGFENAIAEIVARDLGRRVEYTWWPQRRGFIRTTLRAGVCDVVMGVPDDYELTLTTKPYYRSSYVFVSRRARHLGLRSVDDPRLRQLDIGIHVVGDDYANVPPGDALVARGIADNIRGYSIYGDYARPNPPADLIDAVARGEVDVAIAWGPLAGFFAQRRALEITPVATIDDVPLQFSISMGVRKKDRQLRDTLNEVLERRSREIDAVLRRFHVPIVEKAS